MIMVAGESVEDEVLSIWRKRIKYVQYPKVKNYPESLYLDVCHGIERRVGWGGGGGGGKKKFEGKFFWGEGFVFKKKKGKTKRQ